MFFVNLTINGLITKDALKKINHELLSYVVEYTNQIDKKNEVDEITENIAILYNKDIYDLKEGKDSSSLLINGKTMLQIIKEFAQAKSKDYKSLSNKSIFKYMDLIDM
jgi:hypothetical protein